MYVRSASIRAGDTDLQRPVVNLAHLTSVIVVRAVQTHALSRPYSWGWLGSHTFHRCLSHLENTHNRHLSIRFSSASLFIRTHFYSLSSPNSHSISSFVRTHTLTHTFAWCQTIPQFCFVKRLFGLYMQNKPETMTKHTHMLLYNCHLQHP